MTSPESCGCSPSSIIELFSSQGKGSTSSPRLFKSPLSQGASPLADLYKVAWEGAVRLPTPLYTDRQPACRLVKKNGKRLLNSPASSPLFILCQHDDSFLLPI